MTYRNVGIDIAVVGRHHATVLDEAGEKLSTRYFQSRPVELEELERRALKGAGEDACLRVMLDSASLAWFSVAHWFRRRGHVVHLVSNQKTHDLRRYFSKHAKSDPKDSFTLAKHPLVDPKGLVELYPQSPELFMLSRLNREHDRYVSEAAAMKNRITDLVQFAVPDLKTALPVGLFHAGVRDLLREYLSPARVVALSEKQFAKVLQKRLGEAATPAAVAAVYRAYHEAAELFNVSQEPPLYFDDLQEQLSRYWDELEDWEAKAKRLKSEIGERYRKLNPSQQINTYPGIAEITGPSLYATMGGPDRFQNLPTLRKHFGFVPKQDDSATSEKQGQQMTQAGPSLGKKHLYLVADIARQWDPDAAAYYWDQVVKKGKCHTVAVVNTGNNKVLPRLHVLLREDRPYQLRDPVTGKPLTKPEARQLILERYTVPEEIREARRSRKRRRARSANDDRKGEPQRSDTRAESPSLRR